MDKSILDRIGNYAAKDKDRIVMKSPSGQLTYGELWRQSDNLAARLNVLCEDIDKPVMVFGHKNPQMLVCFLACAKAGRAYCPVDISMSESRIGEIADTIGNDIILSTEVLKLDGYKVISPGEIRAMSDDDADMDKSLWIKPDDVFYIIFTSGSTGKPKGVEITRRNLENFLEWSAELASGGRSDTGLRFLNQAPLSFDLSVMDTYTALYTGGSVISLDSKLQQDTGAMFEYMENNSIECWVSTPSFAEMCMADRKFNNTLLRNLKTFMFCGERLAVETAAKLSERFPESRIINTYGPTETTVAVTAVEITGEIIKNSSILPIGVPKKGTKIFLRDGELLIGGNTVGKGYFKEPEKTQNAFITLTEDGESCRVYKTGDRGYFKDGNYYCSGRMDFQIKFHGYRIELGDIESNLMQIEGVEQAAVLPKYDGERIRSLVALVKAPELEGTFSDAKALKEKLKEKLPVYMVPKNIKFLEAMPVTANGKLDRKKLEADYL